MKRQKVKKTEGKKDTNNETKYDRHDRQRKNDRKKDRKKDREKDRKKDRKKVRKKERTVCSTLPQRGIHALTDIRESVISSIPWRKKCSQMTLFSNMVFSRFSPEFKQGTKKSTEK